MEIKVSIEANITIQNGETNVNEIFYAVGNLVKQIGCDVCKVVIENYQNEIVKLLCTGKGKTKWADVSKRLVLPGNRKVFLLLLMFS